MRSTQKLRQILSLWPGVIFLTLTATAGTPSPEPSPPFNCVIHIDTLRKSGERSSQDFRSLRKSKLECQKAAQLHERNFAPLITAEKKVRWDWIPGAKK